MSAEVDWLRANRCPHCKKRRQEACPYVVRPRRGGGYVCKGFRSRHWDERMTFAKEG